MGANHSTDAAVVLLLLCIMQCCVGATGADTVAKLSHGAGAA